MNKKLSFLWEVLSRNARPYYTNTAHKSSLYGRITPLGDPGTSVAGELNGWVQKGKKVNVAELQRIIRDLRKRKRFSQALEVSEWMKKKGVCIFTPVEHAVQIDLIGKVHGFASAESYFEALHVTEKIAKTYGALLSCYVRQQLPEKSLSHFQTMKQLGFASSSLTYNNMMSLYANTNHHEKVPEILAEMKENRVSPDNFSYRFCMNAYGAMSDIEGMERVLSEMECRSDISTDWNAYSVAANFYAKAGLRDKAIGALRKLEERVERRDGVGFNHLISLYAALGERDEVSRVWSRLRRYCERCINRDYLNVCEALARLGELVELERVLEDWESSGNCYDFRVPNTLVQGYAAKGECEKAEALLVGLAKNRKATTSDSWVTVAGNYMEKGKRKESLRCLKRALSLHSGKSWRPKTWAIIVKVLGLLGEQGSVKDVELFAESTREVVGPNKYMYCALLKAYTRAGKNIDGLLQQMKSHGIDQDQDIKSLLPRGRDRHEN